MDSYDIVGKIILGFLEGNEQQDYFLNSGSLETNGRTVWYIDSKGRRLESITTANVIDVGLEQGLLRKRVSPRHGREASCPDDIRADGWTVAVHNDYRLHGKPHTFWLFTKADRCVKGEGETDAEALNAVRAEVRSSRAVVDAEQTEFEAAERKAALDDTRPCPECGVSVTACPPPCADWGCAFHAHLGRDCPSETGARYRERVAGHVRERDRVLASDASPFLREIATESLTDQIAREQRTMSSELRLALEKMLDPEDFSWIKVKRYVDDPSLTWEERYRRLEAHHTVETEFLINRLRMFARGMLKRKEDQ